MSLSRPVLMASALLAVVASSPLASLGSPAGSYAAASGLRGPTLREPLAPDIAGVTTDVHPETVLVRLRPEAAGWEMAGSHGIAGASEVIYEYPGVPGLLCVRVPRGGVEAAVAAYNLNPAVAYAEPNFIRRALAQSTPYGIDLVNAPAAWSQGSRGFGARVNVSDTGIDATHPDLPTPAASETFIPGETVDDGHAHGTHCSGTVLALDNDEGVVGVVPDADLMIAKVLGNAGSGSTAGVMAGAQWAADNGAHVISMSLGGGGFEQAESDLYAAIVANQNVIVIAAAGNDNNANPHYPSSYPDVVSVSAVDSNKNKASFSNFGPFISLAAPGVGVQSTVPEFVTEVIYDGENHAAGHIGGGQLSSATGLLVQCGFGGTAADFPPEVAGNIALIRRRGLDGNGQTLTFLTKCNNAAAAGAIGVIISNSIEGAGVYSGGTNSGYTFPIATIGTNDGNALDARLAALEEITTTVNYYRAGHTYAFFNGTSMACPHVAGVAGLLIASFKPAKITVAQLREAMENSAEDLGDAGRDDIFGHGLVDADAAYIYLRDTVGVCRLDYNSDGVLNPDDIGDYITEYFTLPAPAGPWGYAVPCPGNAPPYDRGYRAAYTQDGSGQCGEPFPDNLGDFITGYFTADHCQG
ncbi:MAG: S8 family serine peptidase [Phycisphaerales bacterium]